MKHGLHQRHIHGGSAHHGDKHVALPEVEENDDGAGNELRNAVAAGHDVDAAQPVDYQNSKNGGGENVSQVLNILRGLFPGGKDKKGG